MPNPRTVAIKAAQKAGKVALALSKKKINFTAKNTHDILAEADLASEKIILSQIKRYFPDHSILSEESGMDHRQSEYLWIVDPLDGTINFSRGFEEWCISIALEYRGQLHLGVVYQPMLKKLYVAEKGKGATLNGKKILVSRNTEPVQSLVATDGTSKVEARKLNHRVLESISTEFRSVRIFGAGALGLAKLAEGKLDAYFRAKSPIHYWDYAAGVFLITEAGGLVTDFSNQPFHAGSDTLLATNGRLHVKALQLINS